jgi:cystathionine beta-lyase/cystathionine gamma-synthase
MADGDDAGRRRPGDGSTAEPSEHRPGRSRGFATRAIHEGGWSGPVAEQPVSPPVWLTSDYLYEGLDHYADVINERRPGFVYGRYGNPTHIALNRVVASLEGAEAAWSFASGMAAMHTALTSLVRAGDHVVAQRTIYGGTFSLLRRVFAGYGIEATFADPEADAVAAAITPRTKVVVVETLANPTFRVPDVEGVGRVCADARISLVVDNTVATPYLFRALEVVGVTLVVHSTSKYISGHSDVIGGAAAGTRAVIDPIRALAIDQGTTSGAFEAWLALRGVQTLPLRMERQCATALALATALNDHSKVKAVGYSGLPGHSDHGRAASLFGGAGFGAMLSFDLKGGYDTASRMCDALGVARVGSSFGGLRTEVCHPGTTSHRQLSPDEREAAGITDGLLRVAVGGEDPEDLVEDFVQALDKA